MPRKRLRLLVEVGQLFAVCAVLAGVLVLCRPKAGSSSWEKYQQIQPRMTEEEVEAILGFPTWNWEEGWGTKRKEWSLGEAERILVMFYHIAPDTPTPFRVVRKEYKLDREERKTLLDRPRHRAVTHRLVPSGGWSIEGE